MTAEEIKNLSEQCLRYQLMVTALTTEKIHMHIDGGNDGSIIILWQEDVDMFRLDMLKTVVENHNEIAKKIGCKELNVGELSKYGDGRLNSVRDLKLT